MKSWVKKSAAKATAWAVVGGTTLACLPYSFGQDATVTKATVTQQELVNTSTLQTSLLNNITGYLGIGLSVGISILAVRMGWNFLRQFASK